MRRGALALGLTTTLVGLGWISPAAQAQPAATSTAATATATATSTTAPPATTTTTAVLKFQNPTTTTTTVGRATTTTTVARITTTTKPSAAAKATTTTSGAGSSSTPNPAMIALANSVRRSGPSNDSALLAALAPLKKLGYTTQQAEIAGMGQFPVAGPATYTDDWLEYRPGPTAHNHMGIDIDAALGTPIRSPVGGTLTYDTTDPDGYGLAADVVGTDKTEYVMAHMSATVTGLKTGSTVTEGEVVGFIGDSGDATGPHVHFEVHLGGGPGINGKPILDAWMAQAIKGIAALVSSLEPTSSTTSTTTANAAGLTPLQLALPANQSGLPHSLAITLAKPPTPAGSLKGLALVALLMLLAALSLSLARFRPPAAEGAAPKEQPKEQPRTGEQP